MDIVTKKYQVFNYREDPKLWEHFLILGEIRVEDTSYFVVTDLVTRENFIKQLVKKIGSGIQEGNALISVESDEVWKELRRIAEQEHILTHTYYEIGSKNN